MKRIINIARNHEEARRWDIRQAQEMTVEERQEVAHALRVRFYGTDTPDVREWHRNRQNEERSSLNNP